MDSNYEEMIAKESYLASIDFLKLGFKKTRSKGQFALSLIETGGRY